MSRYHQSVEKLIALTGKGTEGPLTDGEWKQLWRNNCAPWHHETPKPFDTPFR